MSRSFRPLASWPHVLILAFSLAPLAFLAGCSNSNSTKSGDGKSAGAKDNAGDQAPGAGKYKDGRAVLEAMAAAYRTAKTYQDNGTVRLTAQSGSKKLDEKHDFSVAFVRPNKIHLDVYGVRIRCDGHDYHAFIGDMPGQIVEKDAPAKLDIKNLYGDPILVRTIALGGPAASPPQPLLLLENKALDFILAGAETPVLSEPGEIEGRKCFRVQIPRPEGGVTFWIDQKNLVLRRIMLSTEALRPSLAQKLGGEVESSSLVADFTGAALDEKVSPVAFQFEMPRGEDVRVEKYFIPAHPGQLAGKKTPAFKFTDDAGRTVTPESLTGKIAVMHFWSPEQGDASQILLDMQKIYDGYKDDKNVAIFSVCLDGESLDKKAMEEMRQSLNLHLPIYRDLEKNTPDYKYYDVVFILGPYGVVQDYELVADANLLPTLQRKIEGAIAGQSLAEDAQRRYQQDMKDYAKEAEVYASGEPQAAPPPKVAARSEPKTFKLKSLWKSADLKDPGNILVLSDPKRAARLLVVSPPNQVAEIGLDGKIAAVHKLNLSGDELVTNLRAFTTPKGKTYIAAFAGGQQRLHLFDLEDKQDLAYPPDALQNPHSGIADVELCDLDGDGTPEIYVGFAGVVGLHAVALDGKRIWGNRSLANVARMGAGPADADGRRSLICTNFNDQSATLAVLDAKGQRQTDFTVGTRMIYCFLGADLAARSDLLWCGLSSTKPEENTAVGFNLQGQELWHFDLSDVPQPRPIEPIVAGRLIAKGPGQWLLPCPDGSIRILAADGKPVDAFNSGVVLQGLATAEIGGKPALLIASPGGLEAFSAE
jgi:hypothetical protein